MDTQASSEERRRAPRIQILRPVKIRCEATGKFYTGQTQNISDGGALFTVDHPSLLVTGQKVRVGIAWASQQMLMNSSQLSPATVARSLGHDAKQDVAIYFDQSDCLSQTA